MTGGTAMKLVLALLAATILAASPAEAHLLGQGMDMAFAGFAHPFSGLDHVLAMVAVGLWAAQQGRPATLLLPTAFPAAMVIGGLLGTADFPLPAVETGIAASVAVLGTMILLSVRPPLAVGAALISLFALLHGFAHGAELPAAGSPIGYGLGFVVATAILHLTGIGLGQIVRLPLGFPAMRLASSAIATAGFVLLVW
jgi:urease accessory protein